MFEIPIYSDELDIADKIKQGCSISHLVECKEVEQPNVSEQIVNQLIAASKSDTERTNFDLHYLQALLVTSILNENQDYFSPLELWQSRNTVADKPFNIEHECDDIIGHTVGGYVIDDAGKIVPNDITVDKLPDTIHIIANSVIYKYWSKEDKQKRINQLLAEVKDGKWSVSVECLFPNFDYMLIGKTEHRIIERNNKTSFLTKYLKAYGGKGVFQGEQIARVPRNFILSGKGLVKKPANAQSFIFAKKLEVLQANIIFKNNIENLEDKNSLVYTNSEVIKMNDTDKAVFENQIKSLQADLVKRDTEYTQLKASIDNSKHQELTAKFEKVSKDLETVGKDVEAKVQEINSLKASIEKLNTDKIDSVKELEKINAAKKELEDKLNKIETDKSYTDRVNLATAKLKLTKENAEKFVDGLSKLDNETFNNHVEFQSQLTASVSPVVETKTELDPKALENAQKAKTDVSLGVTQTTAANKNAELRKKFAELLDAKRDIREKPKFQRA